MTYPTDPVVRFWAKVEKTETCWLWKAGTGTHGYGTFADAGRKPVLAHRFAYEAFVGPIPDGLTIDHLCHTPLCVNPDHLEPVTQQENCRRAKARLTHCPQGHPYDEANTWISKSGHRQCRTCNRDRQRALREAALAAREASVSA